MEFFHLRSLRDWITLGRKKVNFKAPHSSAKSLHARDLSGCDSGSPPTKAMTDNTIWAPEMVSDGASLLICSDGGDQLQRKVSRGSQFYAVRPPLPASSPESGIKERSSSGALEGQRKLKEMDEELRRGARLAFDANNRFYIPLDHWGTVMSKQAIWTILPCLVSDSADEFRGERLDALSKTLLATEDTPGSEALLSYRKVLAILILTGKANTIELFVKERISDVDIPLTRFRENSKEERLFRLCKGASQEHLACFQNWEHRDVKSFDDYQWELSAPFFSRGIEDDGEAPVYELSLDRPLPFHEILGENSRQAIASPEHTENGIDAMTSDGLRGAYGQVTKMSIHPAHHNIRSYTETKNNPTFAIKYLFKGRPNRVQAFRNEVRILNRLNTSRDDHFVKLILAMEMKPLDEKGDTELYLMFPLAEGNLRQFWSKTRTSSSYGKWFAKQCYGITVALGKFHNLHKLRQGSPSEQDPEARDPFYGIHGDIKPANLLCFRTKDSENGVPHEAGVIKLADFGTSSIHHTDTIKSVHQVEGTTTYRPPEANFCHEKGCTQSYDIWSLGCVFLEFGCWMVQGGQGVEDFRNARTLKRENKNLEGNVVDSFYQIKPAKNMNEINFLVNPVVEQVISKLDESDKCSPFIRELLQIVENDMLVIEKTSGSSIEQDLVGDKAGKSRISCFDLSQKLKSLIEKGERDRTYFEPCPHSGKRSKRSGRPSSRSLRVRGALEELVRRGSMGPPSPGFRRGSLLVHSPPGSPGQARFPQLQAQGREGMQDRG